MKRLSFLINILITLIILGCKEKQPNKELTTENLINNKVVFKIDERTEFFRTIFNLAVQDVLPEDIRPCQTAYLKRVNEHFLPFKKHPLIEWVYEDENIGIDFSTIGLMYKSLENFEFDSTYEKKLKSYGLKKETLDSIQPLMLDFYQKSGFHKFFENNKEYYQNAISKIENEVSEENLFGKVMDFYQEKQDGLELVVFVELTNNANNKAIDFYDNYNSNKRALILINYCDDYIKPNETNESMVLNNSIRGILYHETSHLFTTKLLKKHIGDLTQYKSICEDCSDTQIMNKVDHMIVFPLQAAMMKRFDNNNGGHDFYVNKCEDVRKEIYKRLSDYQPENKIPFESIYVECINLIKEASKSKHK
ncbi:DUF4932 domain-containing protein [Aquimarina rhabdastrellae]